MKKMGWGSAAVMAVAMAASSVMAEEKPATPPAPPAAEAPAVATQSVSYSVTGMTCGGCAKSVVGLYKKVDGVVEAKVDHKAGTAVVTYDPKKVKVEQIDGALAGTNYTATKAAQ